MTILQTPRLVLRPWRDDDLEVLSAMSSDREVMACYPKLATREDCVALVIRQRAHLARHGFGLWAVEAREGAALLGYAGIQHVPFEAPFTPTIEIGWRLARAHWGNGYASEAARAAIEFVFETVGLTEIVAFLIPANTRSAAVCARLGMSRDPSSDFDHPRIAAGAVSVAGHPLQRHVLYRLRSQRA